MCCVGMWNRGVWAVEKLVVSRVCVSEATTVNGCEVDVKCEWQQEGGVVVWW